MRHAMLLLQTISLLLAGTIQGSASTVQGPPTPASLVAKTVAWQAHWDDRAGLPTKVPSTVTFKMHERSDVWIIGLDWVIMFVYEDSQPFPHFVQRLSSPPDEVRQRALEPFAKAAAVTVKVPRYDSSFRKLSAVNARFREKLLEAFKHEACAAKMLAFYKSQIKRPTEKIHFWIAPVDLDFPVMLYVTEGVPYVGRVDFDTHSLRALYSDFDYIGDEGTELHKQGLRLIGAIRQEGDRFDLQKGTLVPAH